MSDQPDSAAAARRGRWMVWALGTAWTVTLWALMSVSANPVVVNRVQILSSHLIVSGTRDPQSPNVVIVDKVWKGPKPSDRVTVGDWPAICPTGKVVVPLQFTPDGNGFRVTHGEFPNPPVEPKPIVDPKEIAASSLQPLVYPATEDVVRQVEALVGETAGR